MKRLISAVAVVLCTAGMSMLGCDRAEDPNPPPTATPTSAPSILPATTSADDGSVSVSREENAARLRAIGEAIRMYAETHATTTPSATTRP